LEGPSISSQFFRQFGEWLKNALVANDLSSWTTAMEFD
jgi:hypothetical protein